MRSTLVRTILPLAVACALLGGCSSAGATSSEPAAGGADGRAGVQNVQVPAEADSKTGAVPESPITGTQQVVRTAAMNVVVADPAASAVKLRSIATVHDGVITSENVMSNAKSAYSTSTVVMSVPADQLDAALTDIAAIGDVTLRTIQSADVTAKVADIDARVKTMRESIARMQDLLTRAGSVAEIAQVESELTRRQSDLESLLAQQKALAQRVAQSPITVTLSKEPIVVDPEPEPTGFLAGLSTGWKALKVFTVGLLTLVGAMLPFLAFIAIIGAPIVWLVRRRRTPPTPATEDSSATPPAA